MVDVEYEEYEDEEIEAESDGESGSWSSDITTRTRGVVRDRRCRLLEGGDGRGGEGGEGGECGGGSDTQTIVYSCTCD